jgi:DNA-binding GntR family transcriptional regulator
LARPRTIGSEVPAVRGTVAPGGSLVEFAADHVRESILVGALPAGERILVDEIASDLGISPIPVREALRMIATEGLALPTLRRGYTVASARLEDLRDTYQVRVLLEPLATRLAVPRLDAADVANLANEVDLLEAAIRDGNWKDHHMHHRAFHFGIYQRCDSPWLIRFTEMLWANSQRYQYMTVRFKGEMRQRLVEHRDILASVEAGDAEGAAELMRNHLIHAQEPIAAFLTKKNAEDALAASDSVTTKQ